MSKLIGVRAAARILGVHENTVRNLVKRGWLTEYHLPLGGKYLRLDEHEVVSLALANAAWARHVSS